MAEKSEPHIVSDPSTPEAKAASEQYWRARQQSPVPLISPVALNQVREQFERALKNTKLSGDSYAAGVGAALGWLLGEYDNPPFE